MKKFSPVYVAKLTINNLFSLSQSSIEIAKPLIAEIGGIPQLAFSPLETANAAMAARMNQAQREELTPKIKAADKDRDQCFAELKREVSNAAKSRDAAKAGAGNKLMIYLEPYWELQRGALNTETEVMSGMLSGIGASADLTTAASTVGVSGLLADLATLNNTFKALYVQRNTSEASESGPSASSLRPDVEQTYEQFCTAIEQLVNFAPTSTLNTLFNKLDLLRKKYAALPSPPKEKTDAGE